MFEYVVQGLANQYELVFSSYTIRVVECACGLVVIFSNRAYYAHGKDIEWFMNATEEDLLESFGVDDSSLFAVAREKMYECIGVR